MLLRIFTRQRIRCVANIAALRVLALRATEKCVFVLGYHAAGDGGGGDFYWDSASTDDNGGTVIKPDWLSATEPGRWRRAIAGAISVRWFGAKGSGDAADAPTNNTALQAALDACLDVYLPPGIYVTTAPLTVRSNAVVLGAGRLRTAIVNTATTGLARQGVGAVNHVLLAGFAIRSGRAGVPARTSFDLAGFQYGKFYDLRAEFATIGFAFSRPAGVATFFNTLRSAHAASCQVGLDVDSTNSGVNANVFSDIIIDDTTTVMTHGIKLSGAGNLFDGVYVGGALTDGILFRSGQTCDRNVLQRVYIEGTPTDGIDADIGPANRRNIIIGVHFDGNPTNAVRDPDNQLTIIDTDGISIGGRATSTYRFDLVNGKLRLRGTGGEVEFQGPQNAKLMHTGAFSFILGTNGVDRVLIDSSGNVQLQGVGALRVHRVTTGQRDALVPANGDIIYNTTLNKFQGYENGAWVNLI